MHLLTSFICPLQLVYIKISTKVLEKFLCHHIRHRDFEGSSFNCFSTKSRVFVLDAETTVTLLGTTMDPAIVCTFLAKPTPDTVPIRQAAQANTFKDSILFSSLERLCLIHMIQLISPIIMARVIRH